MTFSGSPGRIYSQPLSDSEGPPSHRCKGELAAFFPTLLRRDLTGDWGVLRSAHVDTIFSNVRGRDIMRGRRVDGPPTDFSCPVASCNLDHVRGNFSPSRASNTYVVAILSRK